MVIASVHLDTEQPGRTLRETKIEIACSGANVAMDYLEGDYTPQQRKEIRRAIRRGILNGIFVYSDLLRARAQESANTYSVCRLGLGGDND
ncbi:hypothetical protein KIH39_18420 [Telmatocola sphagniphila]|uniref:Uncharacterized protein n=1 Tax=Telmatocola sphagniphila TaxID=1123043 RepID=A0A8E6B5D5_9BACT|nr:hypothetical protein [Telmatocola sphagniphila]QVL30813.1 hypothetical protein KIH39_18420 [Telmatocola sphagniphila]